MNFAYRQGFASACRRHGVPESVSALMLKAAEADPNLQRATEIFKDWLTVPKHVVRNGEVLSGIANGSGVGLRELMEFNGMSNALVRPGQVLRIPPARGGSEKKNVAKAPGK